MFFNKFPKLKKNFFFFLKNKTIKNKKKYLFFIIYEVILFIAYIYLFFI